MFYYNQESGWKSYDKKVTYTETVTAYENDTAQFDGKTNLVITKNVLTNEELERLEVIRHKDMALKDVIEYVKTGVAQGQVIEADKQARARKALLASIDVSKVPSETLIEAGLTKEWEDTEYFTVGEPIMDEGVLYKVLQGHDKQSDWKPNVATSLFAKVLTSPDGTPKAWVQPNSTNAYKIGDKVLYKGVIWTSKINANVTIPDGDVPYNRYWTDKQTDKVKNK